MTYTTKAQAQAGQAIKWITAACALDSLSHLLTKENEQKQRLARHVKRYGDKRSKAFVRISENIAYWHYCYVFSIRKIQDNLTTGV